MRDEVNKRVAKEFSERLEKIKSERVALGLDKVKNGFFASDTRLTRAIVSDEFCRTHWNEIEKRLTKLPRGDKK